MERKTCRLREPKVAASKGLTTCKQIRMTERKRYRIGRSNLVHRQLNRTSRKRKRKDRKTKKGNWRRKEKIIKKTAQRYFRAYFFICCCQLQIRFHVKNIMNIQNDIWCYKICCWCTISFNLGSVLTMINILEQPRLLCISC